VSKSAKSGKKKKGRSKSSPESDRVLLDLGEDLLTAVHLHHVIQDDDVRAALAAAHPDLVQASGDLVSRIAERFLKQSGLEPELRSRDGGWAEAAGDGAGAADEANQSQ